MRYSGAAAAVRIGKMRAHGSLVIARAIFKRLILARPSAYLRFAHCCCCCTVIYAPPCVCVLYINFINAEAKAPLNNDKNKIIVF